MVYLQTICSPIPIFDEHYYGEQISFLVFLNACTQIFLPQRMRNREDALFVRSMIHYTFPKVELISDPKNIATRGLSSSLDYCLFVNEPWNEL